MPPNNSPRICSVTSSLFANIPCYESDDHNTKLGIWTLFSLVSVFELRDMLQEATLSED